MPYTFKYDFKLEREYTEEGEKLWPIGRVISEIAEKVAERWDGTYVENFAYIGINEGLQDYIYVGDKIFRAPWRAVFPILLKQYGVVVIDNLKLARKEKVVEEIKQEIEMLKQEIATLAKKKSKTAKQIREILEERVNLLSKALDYLTKP
jgi:cell division protein FtsB